MCYQTVVSCVQSEIASLRPVVAKDRNYLVSQLEHNKGLLFKDPVQMLVDAGRQAKAEIYEKSKQKVNVYGDGWQSLLTNRSKTLRTFSRALAFF